MRKALKEIETVIPKSRASWRKWLSQNHDKHDTIWLVIAKKGSGLKSLTVAEAVEEALCFGWIDSVANKMTADQFKIRFSKRNPKSRWSAINKNRVKRLIKEGLMTDVGLEVIKAAKKSGTWTALDKVERLEMPKDLEKAFKKFPTARKHFDAFPQSARKAILDWISSAKQPETRERRILETVTKAEKNIRANQWTRKS